jgi:pilus assembly protein CpaF
MASAINILVHLSRLTGGPRKVVSVAELTGMENDTICLQEVFRFRQKGIDEAGNAYGYFEACGVRPHLLERMRAENVDLPEDLFLRRVLRPASPQAQESR